MIFLERGHILKNRNIHLF